MDALKTRCLYKLDQALLDLPLPDETAQKCVSRLLQYTYANTTRHGQREEDELRNLVVNYVAAKANVLARNDGFLQVLMEDGELVSDFIQTAFLAKACDEDGLALLEYYGPS